MKIALENNPVAVARLQQIEHDIAAWANKNVEVEFDYSGTHLFSMMELAYCYAKRCNDLVGPTLHTFIEMDLVSEVVTPDGEVQVVFTGTKDTVRTSSLV